MPDDFCLMHGYEFMKRGTAPHQVPVCTKCEEQDQRCPCVDCECAVPHCNACTCVHPLD